MKRLALLTAMSLLACPALPGEASPAPGKAAAPPPAFASGPTARADGERVRVEFELDRAADVAVYVLDAKGAVVRHLAAGLLGEKAPKPLAAGVLKQSLVWDGLDDAGKKAEGGPYKVRVAAGLGAKFDGAAFGSEAKADDLTNVIGLAARPEGGVYVLSERWRRAWWRNTAIHAFARGGAYEKTIKPFPATVPAERVKKLTPFTTDDGRPMPVVYRVLAMSYYPHEDLAQNPAVTPDGNIHFLVNHAGYYSEVGPEKRLASLGPDGGLAFADYAGAQMPAETGAGDLYLTSASDGKSVFVTGFERGPGENSKDRPNCPAVWRITLPERDKAAVFFGDIKTAGAGETGLKDPRGIASDGKGQLYVADRGNDRIVVLDEKTGKFVRAIEFKSPGWLGLDRKRGALFVANDSEVVKLVLGADGAAAEKGRVRLPPITDKYSAGAKRSFALDDSGERAELWAGLASGGELLVRSEEKPDGTPGDFVRAGYRQAFTYWNVAVGLDGRTAGCKVGNGTLRLVDEDTGKSRDLALGNSGIYRLGPNNQIYGMEHAMGIRRWTAEGKGLPFPATAADAKLRGMLGNHPSGTTSWERDFDVDRAGRVFTKDRGKVYHGRMRVDEYDADGNLKRTAIWCTSDGAHGPRLDAAGNIYMADSVRPAGEHVPAFFKDRLPDVKIDKRGSPLQQYRWMYASIVKFPPAGGAIWFPVEDKERDAYAFEGEAKLPAGGAKVKVDASLADIKAVIPAELENAEWHRYGMSYVLDMHPGHNRRCHCTATEFDVDDFGRVFYPDQGRFRVVVLDPAGNELTAFGQYGNQDSTGPDLAVNWFTGLGVSDRYAYVADGGNHRVSRVKLVYAADQTVEVK